ncbi:DUF2927 domain-containing protein [Aliiruegeria haliotis]|uniref:DUF2927 domain-containing protein n=1 Tax=Aliiruegeria haliotis TaxID=1280846 RepID=UPI000D063DD1|nr:DUF2927 domain-containing protein [Aliiruegeria haliotis]
MRAVLRTALLGAGLAVLAGCEPTGTSTSAPGPVAVPDILVPQQTITRSETSLALERHYARVQADLLAQGLLRTDGGGPDTPFAAHTLVNNFVRIALYDEYVSRGGTLVAQQTASQLRRWEQPVRLHMSFGASVPKAKQDYDSAALNTYARRLSRAANHPISVSSQASANFHVLVLHEDERRSYGPELRQLIPGIGDTAVRTVESMPRETFCLVFAFSRGDNPAYTRAVAVIRAEHPDLLRLSCLHEEVAQGLGLANDSPAARPSIFNDDEEFALLTRHDELLLRILYDRRLSTGLDAETARPIVAGIAKEMMAGGS